MMSRAKAKKHIKYLEENAVMIKCCYCLIKDNCKFRKSKETSENMGFKTYCTMTPNRPRSFKKKNLK